MPTKKSLKWFLIISLVLAILVPILLVGTIFTNVLTTSLKKNIITGNESLSQSFVYQIEAYLDQSLKDLLSLKTMIEKQDFEMLHINSLLDSVRQNKDHFTKIQVIDTSGVTRFVSPFDPEFIGIDLSNTPLFKQTQKTRKAYWSNTFISPQSNQPVVSISIPYINGIITGYLSLENLIEVAKKVGQGDKMRITITDQTSSFIVHYKDNMVFERGFDPNYEMFKNTYQGRIMTMEMDHEGEVMLATTSMITQTNWIIVFYQPMKKLFAPIRSIYFFMVIAAAVIIITTTILCVRHIKTILHILNKFTQSAEIMSKGHYDERITNIRYKEFIRLANQFNLMAGAVESRQMELKENEEKYKSIFTAAQDAIILVDTQTGSIINVNNFATCLYSYEEKHFFSLNLEKICDEKDNTLQKMNEKENWRSINHHRKKDGVVFPVEVSGSFHSQADGKQICTLVVRDITKRMDQEKQRRQMEGQLSQARKMEAIGTLAGGIAHDFNNILGAIIGFAELALSAAEKKSKQEKHIQRILTAGKRASELVRQILSFARSTNQEKKPVRLKDIIREVTTLVRASIPMSIDIEVDLESEAIVMAAPIDLHQVLMNLCTNAWHAMKDKGGTLTISLKESPSFDDTHTRNQTSPTGRCAILSVADTGHGINKNHLSKIFDPYFTTKAVGDGSGMGLSVVQGIIRSIRGTIDVKSDPDTGTCFSIRLPVLQKDIPEQTIAGQPLQTGKETILVVDDEEMIVTPTVANLEALGYKTLAFTDPEAALEMVEKGTHAFDLVLTDMTMPKLSGFDLARKINQKLPDLPIILCSGFMDEIHPENAAANGIQSFISKPVTRDVLSLKIREALNNV